MKKSKSILLYTAIIGSLFIINCKGITRTQKGAVIGAAGGGVVGAVVGKTLGNTALGAIIGATVGGVTGAVIGKKMDKQAAEIEKNVPGAIVKRVGEGIEVEFSEKILFGYDKSVLSTPAKDNLDKIIAVLKDYPNTDIEIQGHTDNKGSDSYNKSLSVKRADAVKNYLTSKGVSSSRLKEIGYGEGYPKYSNETNDGRAQNRRVEFLITANQQMKDEAQSEGK